MSENQLLKLIKRDARRIARKFRLKYLDIRPETPFVRSRFGSCDEDRIIRIRLHNLRTGRFLSYTSLIHTLCHELAHVRHLNHSKNFKRLNREILKFARDRGIYNPS